MRRFPSNVAVLLSVSCLALAAQGGQWGQWRGPDGSGAAEGKPPTTWSATENVRWKAEVGGRGSSTPIIWGDRVYLTTAVPSSGPQVEPVRPAAPPQPPAGGEGRRGGRGGGRGAGAARTPHQYVVMALDAATGKTLWERQVRESLPQGGTHQDGTYASQSPVTDGERLYAYFGSQGLYCLDLDGNILWEQNFVAMQMRGEFGEGTSPILYGDKVVVICDHEGESFIIAFDKATGRQAWKTPRDERSTWATPQVVEVSGKPQVITCGNTATRGYDLATGELIWTGPGLTANPIPSPIIKDGVAYLMSGFRGSAAIAVRLDKAKGNIEGTDAILWTYDSNTPYVPSPLLYEGRLYFFSGNSSLLTCLDAATGKPLYSQRIEGFGNIYSSPVAANGHIYITSREGKTAVIKPGDTYELVGVNELGEAVDASIAIVGDTLFVRGQNHLFCIAAN